MKKQKRGNFAWRTFILYIIAVVAVPITLNLMAEFGYLICSEFNWVYGSLMYRFLDYIRDHIYNIELVIFIIGWLVLTYLFLIRPLFYIDDIANAAKRLVSPSNEEITLPKRLYHIEYELNRAREGALLNAERARESERRKNDLIVYLAHDLKTPLTSVIGYLSLLRDEPQISAETRARYTGIALEKAERLEALINEFFDITRFSLTTLTLEPERINLSLMLEQTVSEFMPIFAEKNLVCNAEIQPDTELLCDPDKLARVFDNLLRNAVNYSYSDSAVNLSMTAENGSVTIVVSNRGRTITKEKLDKIFEQFFRIDSSRSSSSGGAGLGLAISKEIIVLHGGEISAKSENESIVFTIILPQR